MSDDANDILMGLSGPPGFSFGPADAPPGTVIEGTVVAGPTKYQMRSFDPNGKGELLFWPDNRPKEGVHIDLQTALRDPSIDDDDGVRRLYVEKYRMTNAIREAIKAAGGKGLEHGAWLRVQHIGYEPNSGGGVSAKTWAANYRPTHSVQDHDPFAIFAGNSEPIPPVNIPAPTALPPGKVGTVTRAQAAAMVNAGVDIGPFVISE